MVIGSDPHDPSHEVRRVADRLATVAARLDEAGHRRVQEFLQWAADAASDGAGRPRRPVPVLRPHALADQVRVLGNDVLTESTGLAVDLVRRCRQLRQGL